MVFILLLLEWIWIIVFFVLLIRLYCIFKFFNNIIFVFFEVLSWIGSLLVLWLFWGIKELFSIGLCGVVLLLEK